MGDDGKMMRRLADLARADSEEGGDLRREYGQHAPFSRPGLLMTAFVLLWCLEMRK